jgi:hypothetical protein
MTDSKNESQFNPWMLIAIAAIAFVFWNRQPSPDPTPGPDDNKPAPVKIDKELSDGSTAAVKLLISSMADDLDAMAASFKRGDLKTNGEAAKLNVEADTKTRDKWKLEMAKLWAPRLGTGDLPANAADIYSSTAAGFRKAVK